MVLKRVRFDLEEQELLFKLLLLKALSGISVHSFAGILSLKVAYEAANEIDSTSTASSEKAGEEEAETTGEAVAGAMNLASSLTSAHS